MYNGIDNEYKVSVKSLPGWSARIRDCVLVIKSDKLFFEIFFEKVVGNIWELYSYSLRLHKNFVLEATFVLANITFMIQLFRPLKLT